MSESHTNRVFLALGSNIEPDHNLPAAVAELHQIGQIVAVSHVWESRPVDGAQQANYLNAAVLMETPYSARQLCRAVIPEIEQQLKRIRDPANRFAARTIDIDVVLFNHDTLMVDHRKIPDPDILERPFLAAPLAELDETYIHPETGTSLGDIASELDSSELLLRQDMNLLPK